MKSAQIREAFLNYFKDKQHTVIPSSPLVPGNDPTLLFTNSGMVQFKDVFLGSDNRPYTRATTAQRCVRAGGKHNDLENVGYTARHHTFFEMLGNFSFGDYFKREAIHFAWEFLTQILKLPKEKLWVTVYKDDKEAEDIWLNEIKINPQAFSRCGEKDNFWSMGDTGPCGPCTEIFYDHGPDVAGGPPGSPEADGDRYIEIWNLVFMQFERNAEGKLTALPKPSVDTGMGLERLAAVLQGVHNNYDTDIFTALIQTAADIAKVKDFMNQSLRVIADHIRSSAFLIADGVLPSNEGRGYVLRRIIRRALRHGYKLGIKDTFFYRLVSPLVQTMGEAYSILKDAQSFIEKVLKKEEEQFSQTLSQGMSILSEAIATLKENKIPGDIAFKLYDTYGFPLDLTADIAREKGLSVDEAGFNEAMELQRSRSQQASRFSMQAAEQLAVQTTTEFLGYTQVVGETTIQEMFKDHHTVTELRKGDKGIIVLEKSPFYAESGGQTGDKGLLKSLSAVFVVEDTQKQGDSILHYGYVEAGEFYLKETVTAEIDNARRQAIRLNHSATHLLHAALRTVLGKHVTQKGSLVTDSYLRFDFSHLQAISKEEIKEIEDLVNTKIRENLQVNTQIMSVDEASKSGAMALFGEKYGDAVRVLAMGDFSLELCGGTHVERTGDIGLFKIISESGIAAGVRRIEAVTGNIALNWMHQQEAVLDNLSSQLKTPSAQLSERVEQLLQQIKSYEKQIQQLQQKEASEKAKSLHTEAKSLEGIQFLTKELENLDINALRNILDDLRSKLDRAVIVLASIQEGKAQILVGVSKPLSEKFHAGQLVNHLASFLGGKGGGRPDMAQGSGPQIEKLSEALNSVENWIKSKI